MKVKVTIEISRETLEGLFVSAYEGGSNYWADFWRPAGFPDGDKAMSERLFAHVFDEDNPLHVFDSEEEETDGNYTRLGTITKESMITALRLMSEGHDTMFGDVVSGNSDVETADVWLQYATMGKVIYG